MFRTTRTAGLAACALSAGLLAAPAVASAGALLGVPTTTKTVATKVAAAAPTAFAGGCQTAPTTKAFARVDGDKADYSVAPGGDFEPGPTPWTLMSGAKFVAGNESLGAAPGARSLALPVGAMAISPRFCVDETNPHFRFAFKVNGVGKGFIARIVYRSAGGMSSTQLLSSKELSVLTSGWQASPLSPLGTLIPLMGGSASVQIQLTGVSFAGASLVQVPSVTIDSVMVDPYRRS